MSEAKKKSEFGIWKKSVRMKDGTTSEVLSFSVNEVRYSAWPNKYKSSAKSPDYNVYIDTYVKPDSGNTINVSPSSSVQFSSNSGSSNTTMQAPQTSTDDLPF